VLGGAANVSHMEELTKRVISDRDRASVRDEQLVGAGESAGRGEASLSVLLRARL